MAMAGDDFKLFASPWSPPAWMKTNNHMLKGGKLKPEYYQVWADYFVKFIESYERAGVPIWGMTVQNEPMAVQTWESCIFTAEEEEYIRNVDIPIKVLVISENWCGDCTLNVPILARISELNNNIELILVPRDDVFEEFALVIGIVDFV